MGFYLSPLVKVIENDISTTTQVVTTTVGVHVVRNPRIGPEMKQVFINSEDKFIATFGTPTNDKSNYIDVLTGVGIFQGMSSCYITAVRPEDATFAGVYSKSDTLPISGCSSEEIQFEQNNTEGLNSIRLVDLVSQDPDEYHNEVFPEGPIDIINCYRGSLGNQYRFAIIDFKIYNEIVRKSNYSHNFPWMQHLLSIDSPLADESEFIILVQKLNDYQEDLDKNWDLVDFYNVSTKENALTDEGLPKFAETVINYSSKYIRIAFNEKNKNKKWNYTTPNWVKLSGGSDGSQEKLSDSLILDAFNLYKNPEEIDVNLFIDSDKSIFIKNSLLSICTERKDSICILDPKMELVVNNKGSEALALTNWRKGLVSEEDNLSISTDRGALYGNWLEVYDRWNKKYRWIPASGYVAAVYATSDSAAEIWSAPAGLNRAKIAGSVRRLAFSPSLDERDLMYKNSINPITSFAGIGKVIWGQKTLLDTTSAFNRINVRRVFDIIEKSIATNAKSYLFEPNDEYTRNQLISSIEPFLREIKGRRGIYDYEVICDSRNNTTDRIDRGELWADIMIKLTRTAEFIILRFTNTPTGANFSELTGSLGGE